MTDLVEPSLIEAGCIEVYDNVIDNSVELINLASSMTDWSDAYVFKNSEESLIDKDVRSNSVLNIDQFSYSTDIRFYMLGKRVWEYCNNYAIKYQASFSRTESMQFLNYSLGQQYKSHSDAGPGVHRVISAILYLNDVIEGGETVFDNFDISISPKQGRLVIFPSNYAYRHTAKPPTIGEKNVIVFWMGH